MLESESIRETIFFLLSSNLFFFFNKFSQIKEIIMFFGHAVKPKSSVDHLSAERL